MKKGNLIAFSLLFFTVLAVAQQPVKKTGSQNKASEAWWKQNNLRVIQYNLPAYEAATLHADSLVEDLIHYSANTLIINAGGIMAFYPTKLPFHYTNPYMKKSVLGEVIEKCHKNNIKVIVRFDFSRVHESIFKEHPDWCYISPKGERIINTDMYVVSINAPYVQEKAFRIIEEVINTFPVDGIFLNMPGYQVRNPYEGKYHGIDQNKYDQESFFRYSGMKLPLEEKKDDPVFQKYLAFKKATIEDWSKRLHELIKSKSPGIAICTYLEKHVDIIRHESQTNSLPYWPYSASDNVGNAGNSYPDHIISNASIQQISFQSRYNAVEPEEVAIRLYENIANGSGLDLSMMGDMRDYEDERNYEVFKKIYALHKKFEPYFGKYTSPAKVAVIAPGSWPSGDAMQEYRGIQLMLKEAHIQYDIVEDAQIAHLAEKIKDYRLIILPDITYVGKDAVEVLKDANGGGTHLIATNRSFFDDTTTLHELFGAKIIQGEYEGSGNYLQVNDHSIFKRLRQQTMLFWKFNLGQYDLKGTDSVFLPILSKGRPGPPEIIGGHEPTGFYAMGLKQKGTAKNVIAPGNLGKLYYLHGYEQHKNILLDVIESVYPQAFDLVRTNAPERVEVILKEYIKNTRANKNKKTSDGLLLHLVNLTGFSGNTYFKPLPVHALSFEVQSPFQPSKVYSLTDNKPLAFNWKDGIVSFVLDDLQSFQAIVMDK